MIIYQTACHSKTLSELAANMRGLPKTWYSPFRYWGTMDDHVWVAEPFGVTGDGGHLFTRVNEVDVNQNGRHVSVGALELVVWSVSGERGTWGADPMLCLAKYIGYAWHVREHTYLLPAGVAM